MASHVDLAGVLFVLWGLLTMLVALSTLALSVGAFAIIMTASRAGGGQFAAGLTAVVFTTVAAMAMVWGLSHVLVGVQLRRRRHWSRLVALALGAVDLVLLPYGTALGVYTMWVLLNDQSKRMFEPNG